MSIKMPTKEEVYGIVNKLYVMKPAVAKKDNAKAQIKLEQILASNEYVAEEKIDGCHYTMLSHYFISTDHIDKTENFPHLTQGFYELGMPNLILDGEINYPGKTSQYCTRVTGAQTDNAIKFQDSEGYIHYTIFDILRLPNGKWVCNEPYETRRKYLEYLYAHYIEPNNKLKPYVHVVDMATENKKAFKDSILARGGEGVVLKRLQSVYVFGKKPMWEWMKIKQADETDLFISGYKEPNRLYTGGNYENWPYWKEIDGINRPVTKAYYNGWIGSLELSAYVNGEPQVICYASGLSESLQKQIQGHEDEYIGRVCRIRFMEKTEDGFPRHPTFFNFHETKTAEECTWEFETT